MVPLHLTWAMVRLEAVGPAGVYWVFPLFSWGDALKAVGGWQTFDVQPPGASKAGHEGWQEARRRHEGRAGSEGGIHSWGCSSSSVRAVVLWKYYSGHIWGRDYSGA